MENKYLWAFKNRPMIFLKYKYIFTFLVFSIVFINFGNLYSQPFSKDYFQSPIDGEILLSGNFAEPRLNHYHSGIDIKTEGVEGKNIYAVADGYVSRIKVSPWGYGLAVYINHPNGYTSVYAHLRNFNIDIDNYIKNIQYKKKSFSIDIPVSKNKLVVKKGDIIGFSGNSGSSFGAHLHFEIRETKTEKITNPLLWGFNVTDNIKPKITQLIVYPTDVKSHVNGKSDKQKYSIKGSDGFYYINDTIDLYGNTSFGISTTDYMDKTNNKFGVYSTEVWVDKNVISKVEYNKFSFYESRYINNHIDYCEKIENNIYVHKSNISKNNYLSIFPKLKNKGIFNFNDTTLHSTTIIVKDFHQNISYLNFTVRSIENSNPTINEENTNNIFMPYNVDNYFENSNIKVNIPKNSLYENLFLEHSSSPAFNGSYSDVYHVHRNTVPLHKKIKVSIKSDSIPASLKDKGIIVSINKKGKFSSIGGTYKDGYITIRTNKFGKFAIAIDTISPVIKPENIYKNAKFINDKSIRFKITDNLSGVSKYNGYIDDKWVLFKYDAKNNLLKYEFDEHIEKTGVLHKISLKVVDDRKNISTYTTNFIY